MSAKLSLARLPVMLLGLAVTLGACAIDPQTQSAVMNRLSEADAAYQNHDLRHAAGLYEDVLRVRPRTIEAMFRLGVISYRLGQFEDAERYFQRVLEHEPRHARALYDLSMVHLEQARRLLRKFERVEPVKASARTFMDLRKALEGLAEKNLNVE